LPVNLYQLNQQQIELAYLVLDKGTMIKDGRMLAVKSSVFEGMSNGKTLVKEGRSADLLRRTKSGIYIMQSKRVQQIVSVHDRPIVQKPTGQHPRVTKEDNTKEHMEAFSSLHKERGTSSLPDKQPVTAYLGVAVSIAGLLISTFISPLGLTGVFTLLLGFVGFLLTAIGTIQFFRYAGRGTEKSSKRIHIILTGASFLTLVLLIFSTVISPPRVAQSQQQTDEQSTNLADEEEKEVGESEETVMASEPSVQKDIHIETGDFLAEKTEEGWVDTSLPVTVENTSDRPYVINATFQAENMNGHGVGHPDYLFMVDIEPGETKEFKVYEHASQETASILSQQGVQFVVSEVTAVNNS